jgi:hypothetical protein
VNAAFLFGKALELRLVMPVEERESPATDPSASGSATVPESAEQTPSVIRPVELKSAPPTSDTLLSAPTLTREDLALEERLSTAERNLSELMLRVERLERRPVELHAEAPNLRWIWLLFLAALAIAWQILSRV